MSEKLAAGGSNSAIVDVFKSMMCMHSCFRSGKSSIQKVVFHKMAPNETLYLESTTKVVKDGEWFSQV